MRQKCEATGKSIYPTLGEAKEAIIKFKSFSKYTVKGRRVKHRSGKPKQQRAYYCEYCEGYHQTSSKFYKQPRKKPNA